jgi:hypothetical protein
MHYQYQTKIDAWMQSKYDERSLASAVGLADAIFCWESSEAAVVGLKRELDLLHAGRCSAAQSVTNGSSSGSKPAPGSSAFNTSKEAGGASRLALHLGLAHGQEMAKWLLRSAELPLATNSDVTPAAAFRQFQALTAVGLERDLGAAEEESRAALAKSTAAADSAALLKSARAAGVGAGGAVPGTDGATDGAEATKRLLERVAIVTISNQGYADYTLNSMASLRIKVWGNGGGLRTPAPPIPVSHATNPPVTERE